MKEVGNTVAITEGMSRHTWVQLPSQGDRVCKLHFFADPSTQFSDIVTYFQAHYGLPPTSVVVGLVSFNTSPDVRLVRGSLLQGVVEVKRLAGGWVVHQTSIYNTCATTPPSTSSRA